MTLNYSVASPCSITVDTEGFFISEIYKVKYYPQVLDNAQMLRDFFLFFLR